MKKVKVSRPPLRLVYAEAGSLTQNPSNWRRHPQAQMAALKGALDTVGWAGALLFNERTGRLIDGHARRESVPPETPVPVLVGSWSEAEEKRILLTLDPIAGMALPDPAQLAALMGEVKLDDAALKAELDRELALLELSGEEEKGKAKAQASRGDEGGGEGGEDPGAGKLASSFQVVAVCKDEGEQQRVFELLKSAAVECRINTLY